MSQASRREALIRFLKGLVSTPTIQPKNDSLQNRSAAKILEVGTDTLVLGLILGSISLIRLVLEGLLGHDAKFVDIVSVRWVKR